GCVPNANINTVPPTSGFTALTVDGSADAGPRSVVVAADGFTGLAPSAITFNPARLQSLTLSAGPAGNTWLIADTPQNGPGTLAVVLNTGTGADAVNIQRTQSALTVNGQRGRDTVAVGLNGSMQSINGPVTGTNLAHTSA